MRLGTMLFVGYVLFHLNAIHATIPNQNIAEKVIDHSELSTLLMDLSTAPSAIVGGVVNVITGNYFESECDLVIPGANPLVLQRSYNSANTLKGTLCQFWELNHPSKIYSLSGDFHVRGTSLIFPYSYNYKDMRISKNQMKYGMTNYSTGILSSRTNIKNRKLSQKDKEHYEMQFESGDVIKYVEYDRIGLKGAKVKYHATRHTLANKCYFTYFYDNKDRIRTVTAKGPHGNDLSHITWDFPFDFKYCPDLKIISSDGRKITYQYEKLSTKENKKNRYVLSSVKRSHAPRVEYRYRNEGVLKERLVKKILPDNRYLKIDYYDKDRPNKFEGERLQLDAHADPREGRVLTLHAPVGKEASPILLWSFKYELDRNVPKGKPIGGTTEVVDANGHRKKYRFSDEQRLTSIKHYFDDKRLYREEKLVWGDPDSEKDNIFLMARGISDEMDTLLVRKNYKYDEYGNVLKETFFGNLSGNQRVMFEWDEFRNSEAFSKIFSYNENGLLKSENDGKKITVYEYHGSTDLITLKLVSNNQGICERYHYTYDDNRILIKEIIDDGSSPDINDLRNVTERRIKKTIPTTISPIGLPALIEEYYMCPSMVQEQLIKCQENTFSKEGYLLCQKTFDSDRVYRYTKTWSYDAHGNVLTETDPLGQVTTYKYDANDNRIFQQTPNFEYYTTFAYDFVNRLIEQKEVYANGGHWKRRLIQMVLLLFIPTITKEEKLEKRK